MSRKCPVTEQTCHDSRCQIGTHDGRDENGCEILHHERIAMEHRLERGKMLEAEKTWERHIISKQLRIIDRLTKEKCQNEQKVEQVLVFSLNNSKYITMSLSIVSNQSAPIVLALIDADTKQPVTATFTGETETSDNTAAAVTDPVKGLVGVAPGSGNLTSVATWTYVDKNTNQPVTKTLTTVTPFTVTAVVSAENVEMVVSLGTPVTQG